LQRYIKDLLALANIELNELNTDAVVGLCTLNQVDP
jgi:hypothetical protein